jgi:hypothetical protein
MPPVPNPTIFQQDHMTCRDPEYSHAQFRSAIEIITGVPNPPRRVLCQIGRGAGRIVGHQSWSGPHLYCLLHHDRWPQYQIIPILLRALQELTGSACQRVVVQTRDHVVHPDAFALTNSRSCAGPQCEEHFLPTLPHQRYCSLACAKAAARLRKRTRRGQEQQKRTRQ